LFAPSIGWLRFANIFDGDRLDSKQAALESGASLRGDFQMTLEQILQMKDGPEKKFRLLKMFAAALRDAGVDHPQALSCADIVKHVKALSIHA
jgi:hypothetical protein